MSFLFGESKTTYYQNLASKYRTARDQKREEILQTIRTALKQQLTAERQAELIELPAYELVQQIIHGKLTSYHITLLYSYRALVVGQLLNSNAEEFVLEALEEAKRQDAQRDAVRQKHNVHVGQALPGQHGLLEGIPVSVKDQVNQRGALSTCGMASRLREEYRCKEDGVHVELIRREGGIPFVRTNGPQLLMLAETESLNWGRADNPWNPSRTPGMYRFTSLHTSDLQFLLTVRFACI
jgi:Asp-tRNA(Asn)/Glu-tRNA(Gln) amidotransferase A subunit family amidase